MLYPLSYERSWCERRVYGSVLANGTRMDRPRRAALSCRGRCDSTGPTQTIVYRWYAAWMFVRASQSWAAEVTPRSASQLLPISK